MIVIVGVGALGSHVALLGRNWKPGLKLVDHDRVEMKNVLAQFHGKQGVGKNKAQGLAQGLLGFFGIRAEAVPHKITSDNADVLLRGSELVLDCTDNVEARRVITESTMRLGLPCLHGALSADGSFGRVVWAEHFRPDTETPGQATCEDGEFLPFFGQVGGVMAGAAQQFLRTGAKQSFQVLPGAVIRLT